MFRRYGLVRTVAPQANGPSSSLGDGIAEVGVIEHDVATINVFPTQEESTSTMRRKVADIGFFQNKNPGDK